MDLVKIVLGAVLLTVDVFLAYLFYVMLFFGIKKVFYVPMVIVVIAINVYLVQNVFI